MGLETSSTIEEIKDADGNTARPASDEVLREVANKLSGGGTRILFKLQNEVVPVPTGKIWDVTIVSGVDFVEVRDKSSNTTFASVSNTRTEEDTSMSVVLDDTLEVHAATSGLVTGVEKDV